MEAAPYLFEVDAGDYLLASSEIRPDQLTSVEGISPIGPLSYLSIDRDRDDHVVFAVLERGGRYPIARGAPAECIRRANEAAAVYGVPVSAKALAAQPLHAHKQYTVIHQVLGQPSRRTLVRQVDVTFRNASELFDTCSSELMSPGCPVDGSYNGPFKEPVKPCGEQVWFSLAVRTPESLYAWALVAARLTLMGGFPAWHRPPAEMCPRCLGRHTLQLESTSMCQECLYERE